MFKRFRPGRVDKATRNKNREFSLTISDFIWPVFLAAGQAVKQEISSLPGVYHYSVDRLLVDLKKYVDNGLQSILLFGVPEIKGIEQAYSAGGLVQKAIPIIKQKFPSLEIITDVCLCSYTIDGHCHIGDNDKTCEILARIAVSHARAGADIVAPSDMMDGRVYYIKKALVDSGFIKVKILSYAAKYASNFYGPFRAAADCAPQGDRKTYQMDYGNAKEAMEEIAADIEEGADQIMIKPALAYLDIISKVKQNFNVPIVAYNVSGEYAMLKNGIKAGIFNQDVINESLLAIKRAGASRIVSYFVPELING